MRIYTAIKTILHCIGVPKILFTNTNQTRKTFSPDLCIIPVLCNERAQAQCDISRAQSSFRDTILSSPSSLRCLRLSSLTWQIFSVWIKCPRRLYTNVVYIEPAELTARTEISEGHLNCSGAEKAMVDA